MKDGPRPLRVQEPPHNTDMFKLVCYWIKFCFSAGRARLRGFAARADGWTNVFTHVRHVPEGSKKRRVWCHRIQAERREMLILQQTRTPPTQRCCPSEHRAFVQVSPWNHREEASEQWAISPCSTQTVRREDLPRERRWPAGSVGRTRPRARFRCNKNQSWRTTFKTWDRKGKAGVGAKATRFQRRLIQLHSCHSAPLPRVNMKHLLPFPDSVVRDGCGNRCSDHAKSSTLKRHIAQLNRNS